jgi:uncharacterized protein involved in exopolysaccharide biosynthesis
MELLDNLKVENDRGSSLIRVSYTASDPDKAARTVNAFISVYIQNKKIKRLAEREDLARRMVNELEMKLGDRHPRLEAASAELAQATRAVEEEKGSRSLMDGLELSHTGRVVPAEAVSVPNISASRLLIISALLGVLLGIFVAVLRDGDARRLIVQRLFDA